MEGLSIANRRLRSAQESVQRDYQGIFSELERKEAALVARHRRLHERKLRILRTCGDADAADDDVIEVNAGGKVVAARRIALTRLKGTRLEALFCGRWDGELQRDGAGRVFLDVNPMGFRAIVDHLNELTSDDDPPEPLSVGEEHEHVLRHQLELFGLSNRVLNLNSRIVSEGRHVVRLHEWLGESGSDGDLRLLYRSSRDGRCDAAFHSRCDHRGRTLTIIKTTDGYVVGGYSNTPWTSGYGSYRKANEAFLFVLSGCDIASPLMMGLRDPEDPRAVCHCASMGPRFGGSYDFMVNGNILGLNFGQTYAHGPPGHLALRDGVYTYRTFTIEEMEVFRVGDDEPPSGAMGVATVARWEVQLDLPRVELVNILDVNRAVTAKRKSLEQAEAEVRRLEEGFDDELRFVSAFASKSEDDVVALNVSGTTMATRRSTLCAVKGSALAGQFDVDDVERWRGERSRASEWTAGDVADWARSVEGVPDDAADALMEAGITGRELLALGVGGLREVGVGRAGTAYLLLQEMRKHREGVALMEHDPKCFGRVLDHLRMMRLHALGLTEEAPSPPRVPGARRGRFLKVVGRYFPGDSARSILG